MRVVCERRGEERRRVEERGGGERRFLCGLVAGGEGKWIAVVYQSQDYTLVLNRFTFVLKALHYYFLP